MSVSVLVVLAVMTAAAVVRRKQNQSQSTSSHIYRVPGINYINAIWHSSLKLLN